MVRDRICRRRKGERLAHHFVVFAYAEAYKGEMYGGCSRTQGKELLVLCEVRGQTTLEFVDVRAERHYPVGVEGVGHVLAFGAAHMIDR